MSVVTPAQATRNEEVSIGRSLGQRPELDGIRGLAVSLVVLSHIGQPLLPRSDLGIAIGRTFRPGFLGVDIFFVLSGFLITTLLLDEYRIGRRISVQKFYARRALRLLPALVLFLFAYVVYASITNLPSEPVQQSVWGALFYVANWQTVFHFDSLSSGLGHLWSLSIEEQFYLVWPCLVLMSLRARNRFIGLVLILALILIVVAHRIDLLETVKPYPELFVRTDSRVDMLLVGSLASWLWFHRLLPTRGLTVAASIAVPSLVWLAWGVSPHQVNLYEWGFTAFAALVAVVVIAVLDTDWFGARVFRLRPLRLLGRVSYGLYLWHLPIFKFVPEHTSTWPSGFRLLLSLGLTAFAVTASWHLLERRANRLRHRFSPQTLMQKT